MRWILSEDERHKNELSDQIDELMQNIWPSLTPRQMHLELQQLRLKKTRDSLLENI